MRLVIGFANLGRAQRAAPVRRALEIIHAQMQPLDWPKVLCLNEIDEGDSTTPEDHVLLRREFGMAWRKPKPVWDSREPVLVRGLTIRAVKQFKGCDGLKKWSPNRDIQEVWVAGDDGLRLVIMTGHYPAGAKHGQRPSDVRPQLESRYDQMLAVHRKRIRRHHLLGRNVMWAMDTNWHQMPSLHDNETTLNHRGPDWIRVVPAHGWQARKMGGGRKDLPIEPNHDYLWSDVKWIRRG